MGDVHDPAHDARLGNHYATDHCNRPAGHRNPVDHCRTDLVEGGNDAVSRHRMALEEERIVAVGLGVEPDTHRIGLGTADMPDVEADYRIGDRAEIDHSFGAGLGCLHTAVARCKPGRGVCWCMKPTLGGCAANWCYHIARLDAVAAAGFADIVRTAAMIAAPAD